jgi:hypothetical protein
MGGCCRGLVLLFLNEHLLGFRKYGFSAKRFTLKTAPVIESVSAGTLATHDMALAVKFYRALGFELRYGGEEATFTSLKAGKSYLNLIAASSVRHWSWWGRAIFYVSDVDALYAQAVAEGLRPDTLREMPSGASGTFI